jgi:AraC family transcriptional regulator
MRNTNAYAERVQRVVDYLHDHLDDRFGLEKLAALANFSPYHFHRTYRGLLGETVYDTIRRLRLRRAALDLLDARLSIDRAATRAGYASQAEFTRAFRAEYGEPPARYRDLQAARDDKLEETNMYEVEIVDFAALRVAAIQHRGDYQLMSKAFEKLAAAAATKGFFTDQTRTIGIYHDDPKAVPASELRATACMTVPDDWSPSAELGEARIEGGRYARIVHTGPYTELEKPYDWLYRTWSRERRGAARSAVYRGVSERPSAGIGQGSADDCHDAAPRSAQGAKRQAAVYRDGWRAHPGLGADSRASRSTD